MIHAILFPGQGSQEKGMGRDLAEAESQAMDLWKMAEKASGLPLREIYWDGEPGDMADTRALQPALTAVNLSFWYRIQPRTSPVGMAGHSLGEFAALAAARVLEPSQALELTALRGRLMAEAGGEGHGMAAVVKLDQAAVEEIVEKAAGDTGRELRLANHNSPAQFVISGEKEALDAAAEMVKEQKGRAIPLPVSGAFHSPLIQEAADEFARVLGKMDWRIPKTPVLFNATGGPEADPERILETMKRQMTSSVRWIEIVENLWNAGARLWIEPGPKGVLSKLLKPNLAGKEEEWTALSVDTLEAADNLQEDKA